MKINLKLIFNALFFICMINIVGCHNIKHIEDMSYNDYINEIKNNNYDDFSIIISSKPNWLYVISNKEYLYSRENTKSVRGFLLKNSKFTGRAKDHGIYECGHRIAIELFKKDSTKKIRIIVTDAGFSFDKFAPRADHIFLNDKLKFWLIDQLNKANFPIIAANIDKYVPNINNSKQR